MIASKAGAILSIAVANRRHPVAQRLSVVHRFAPSLTCGFVILLLCGRPAGIAETAIMKIHPAILSIERVTFAPLLPTSLGSPHVFPGMDDDFLQVQDRGGLIQRFGVTLSDHNLKDGDLFWFQEVLLQRGLPA
jgi:hypothetical protein